MAFDLVRSVLMTPPAIGILAIEMVVFSWVDYEGDLAFARWTAFLKCGRGEIRNILAHQILYYGARTAFFPIQGLG